MNRITEIIDKLINKLNLGLFLLTILYLPIFYTFRVILIPFFKLQIPVYYYVLLYLLIPLQAFVYIYNLFRKNIRFSKYDIFIYILICLGIISTINAVDVETSIWGAYSRNEGLLMIISYYLMFLNSRLLNKEDVKKVIGSLFLAGILQCIYSVLQVFVRGNYIDSFTVPHMASGFVGNGNFLGSYCVLILGLSIAMYFIYKKKIYFWLSIIYFINLILAQSTGPFYAFIALFIFLIIVLSIKKIIDLKKLIIVSLTLISTFLVVSVGSEIYCKNVFGDNIQTHLTIKGDVANTLNIFVLSGESHDDSDKEEITENYGSGRLIIWKNTMTLIPKYWLTGAGIDNFFFVYPKSLYGMRVDKAHNEYLQIMVTQGAFTLLIYLLLLLNLFVDGLKSKNKFAWVLVTGFVGYAIQAFMNISVNTVAPLYFIVCGMLAGIVTREKES